jgi:hypothetical protein
LDSVKSIVRAYIYFAKNLRNIQIKRKIIQKSRILEDKDLYKQGVIATLRESIIEEKRLSKVWKDKYYS